ncbi:MAG: hypothetical protein KDE54_04525, partial [Caldilineaceae bacterium]|nr:hypothetical protein [Caldilineaceae bacterium]
MNKQEYERAVALLMAEAASADTRLDPVALCQLLAEFPRELFDANPDLLRLQAHCLLRDERLDEAVT